MLKLFLSLLTINHVLAIIPTPLDIQRASHDILLVINSARVPPLVGTEFPLVAGFVQLAVTDCIGKGGCDGCVNVSSPKNAGLSRSINALNPLFHLKYSRRMSRADFYALASVVALEKGTEKLADKFLGRSQLKFGRNDCSTVPEEDSRNHFPRALGNIDDTLSYFAREFGYSAQETVAFLGGHTLGRARTEYNGFEGRSARNTKAKGVNPASVLDNQYYIEIIRPMVQVDITSPLTGTTKVQWQDPNTKPNSILSRLNPNQPPKLLNSDFCLAHNFTVIDESGHADCVGCTDPTSSPNCCPSSSTLGLVENYANDNALWLGDFTNAFMKMLSRNSNMLVEVSNDSPQKAFREKIEDYLNHILVE